MRYDNNPINGSKATARLILIVWKLCMASFAVAFVPTVYLGITNHDRYHRSTTTSRSSCLHVKKILKESKEKMLNSLNEMEEKEMETTTHVENNITPIDSSSSLFYTVTSDDNMKRLDSVVAAAVTEASTSASVSRSLCSTLVTDGHVTINGNTETRKSLKVTSGMQIEIKLNFSAASIGGGIQNNHQIVAQDIPLSILYEDEYMIVLNKAAGMVVHPAVGNRDGTVVNALAYYLKHNTEHGSGEFVVPNDASEKNLPILPNLICDIDDDASSNDDSDHLSSVDYELQKSLESFRPGIVHRLDKGTTGVLIVAKTRAALVALAEQFGGDSNSSREKMIPRAEKTYLAITVGNPGQRVVIDRPIGRHPIHRQRMRVVPDSTQNNNHRRLNSMKNGPDNRIMKGRRALSFVDTIAFDGKLGFVKVRIETGRTHQIRVHLQDRHTPIYGDDIYGLSDWNKRLNKTYRISRPMLHAFRLKLRHPITGESMTFKAPLPDDMRKIIKTIYPQGEVESPDIFASEL
jgi:23S rRNA pseudouridine1911/1915/1917 synthase